MLRLTKVKRRTTKGQSMAEYMMVIAAILAIMFVFLRPGGMFGNSVNQSLQATIITMNTVATDIFDDITGN